MKNNFSFLKLDKTKSNYLIFVSVFSIILAFVIYYLTKQILFSLLVIILTLGLYFLYASTLQEKGKNNQLILEGNNYIDFYKNFLLFSSLESDYQSGFNRAYDLLPICKLKEKIDDYKEKNLSLEEALSLLSSRAELGLITEIKRCLLYSSEFYENNSRLSLFLDKYIKEIKPPKSQFDYTSLAIILFGCYLVVTFFLVYVSKI